MFWYFLGMQVVAGSISNQSLLEWVNATATSATLTTLTVGEGVALRVLPLDKYMNLIDGGDVLQVYVEAPSNTAPITKSEPEFDENEGIYKGAVSQVFPEGSYNVYVDILAASSQDSIRLGPLMLQAIQLPCNASRHHTPSTLSATCVCMVGAALTHLMLIHHQNESLVGFIQIVNQTHQT